jgi:lipid-binding SYLF domain-containing protein
MHRRMMLTTMGASSVATMLLATGCTTNMASRATPREQMQTIDRDVDAAMANLYASVPGSRELARKARGILVFPKVYEAGFLVGGEYGRGELEIGGMNAGYYKMTGLSVGLQAGAQSKAVIFMFMTQDALDRFVGGSGWTAGVDASVALVKVGANGTLDSASAGAAVNAFALTNAGLMAAATVDGTKVSKLQF